MLEALKHIAALFRQKRGGGELKPLARTDFVVLDTELTGLDEKRDAIISIGAVRMTGGVIHIGETFYRLVNPEKTLTEQNVVIHEILPSELEAKPTIDAVLSEFIEFASDSVLIGHMLSLDLLFLNREMTRIFDRRLTNPTIDTCGIYAWLLRRSADRGRFTPGAVGYRLYDIARSFDIPVNRVHNAIADAYTTAQIFQRFLPLLADAGVHDTKDLLRVGAPFMEKDSFPTQGEFSNF